MRETRPSAHWVGVHCARCAMVLTTTPRSITALSVPPVCCPEPDWRDELDLPVLWGFG